MSKRIDIKKLMKRLIIIGLLAMISGIFLANVIAKRNGYNGLSGFISNYSENKILAKKANPVQLSIEMSDTDYKFLENKRQEALDRGVQINDGDNYVNCRVSDGDNLIDAQIRLKGHMTDHLQGDKWSFRIKSKQKILGMYRFSLQHPGTRGFIYEWIYHELLKQEDIIHLKYDFVQVNLRNKDLGIYALEEHFGQHVLEHNNRPSGAILRWNPTLYWEGRIDELENVFLDEQYSAYTSSYAEPYEKGIIQADSNLIETYKEGVKLLEQFRRGEKTTSEVFDVERMARFHAIIDLVGGYYSLDWSDVKFFYNSEIKRIEPVGYESFSIRKSESIAGQQVSEQYDNIDKTYHERLFADPVFFAAYIENLERICDESYFNKFIQSIRIKRQEKMGILASEWPLRKFSYDAYFENITLIRHNLELPKPFHAFMEKSNGTELNLSIAPVSDFPVELIKIEINGKEKINIEDFILPAKARNTFAHYFPLKLKHSSDELKSLVITARIPGSKHKFKVEVIEYPAYRSDLNVFEDPPTDKALSSHPLLKFNVLDSFYFFDGMEIAINEHYQANGMKLRLLPGQKIIFHNGYIDMRESTLESLGTSEAPVILKSKQETMMFDLWNCKARFNHCTIKGGVYGFRLESSNLLIESCTVSNFSMSFISALSSNVSITSSYFGSNRTIAKLDRSDMFIQDMKASKGDEMLITSGSYVKILTSKFSHYQTVFSLNHLSNIVIGSCQLADNRLIGNLQNASTFKAIVCDLGAPDQDFVLDDTSDQMGESNVYLQESTLKE
jgi:Right handed beta helix region/CotH kinase protein